MSILVEIAEKADVPVEGVIRVLTREPVSDAVLERVLGVLEDLTPEQTRAVQRFALAALHDVIPRPVGPQPDVADEPPAVAEGQLTLPAAPAAADAPLPAAPSPSDAALVQLSGVLSELAEAVRDLRRETDEERRERVDDLAVLIDLITTGWQGLDARLGRIEKQIGRIDTGRRPPAMPLPPVPAPAPAATPAAAATITTEEPAPAAASGRRAVRDRLPLAAALALAGAVIGTFAVLQLASAGPDVADLVSARDESAQTGETGAGVGASSTTGATRPPATAPPATTSSVLGTSVGETQPRQRPPAAPGTTAKASTTAKTTTARSTTVAAPPPAASFKPTRNWAWAPAPNADYYRVEFTRGGKSFYRAAPTEPRLTLPESLVFGPGSYRWIVRPGFGARAANRLGEPIVNSGFTVS